MAGLPRAGVQLVADDSAVFQSAMRDASDAVTQFGQTAERAGGGVSSFGQVATGALRHVGTIAVDAAVQGAKAIGGFVVDSVSAAADYESGMNRFASVTGEAIGAAGMELSDFSALFLKLGAETQFSAAEAQEAAIALAKGGLDPLAISSGALADTLTLAAAGELELGTAAEITAKQLGVWASAGVTSAQVADLLAQAANASTVDVDELALGLANVGGIAKVAGLSFEETVQAMALLAPGFSSAADAGTSFKTFLTRLQPSTASARGAMAELGLFTKETGSAFYDASGNFIGMEAAAQLLQGSLSGLTEAQRTVALQTIFGQDAFRAAALIAEQGAAGYDKMGAAMAGAGTAAEQAAARNQGFKFALESMKGSVETLQIVLGTALLPVLTSLINDYLIPGVNATMAFAQGILSASDPIAALVTSINTVLPGFAGFVGFMQSAITAAQPLIDLLSANLVPVLGAVTTVLGAGLLVALGGVVAGFAAVAAPVAAAVAVLAVLYANIGPIQEALTAFGNTEWGQALQRGAAVAGDYLSGPFVTNVSNGISAVQSSLNTLAASPWAQDVQRGAGVVVDYFAGPFATELASGVDVVSGKLNELGASPWVADFQRGAQLAQGRFAELGAFFANDFSAQLQRGVAIVGASLATFATAVGAWATQVNAGWTVVTTAWNEWVATLGRGVEVIKTGLSAMTTAVGSWAAAVNKEWLAVTTAWNAWTTALGAGVAVIGTGLATALTAISNWVTEVNKGWTAITTAWDSFAKSASSLGAAVIDGIAKGITDGVGRLTSAAADVANAALDAAMTAIGAKSPSTEAADKIGTPFDQGIVLGIEESASTVAGAAISVARGTITAVQDALRMHSGSREAAELIGTPFVMGIVEGIEESADLLTDMARQLSEQLVDDMALVGEAAAEAFKDMFTGGLEGTASVARQKVKNLRDTDKLTKTAGKEEDPYKRDQLQMIVGSTQKQLGDAEAFAATFADPKLGAKYFKEESARIIELAELKQQYIQATTNTEKAALTQQMRLIEEAQAAERALFGATASEQSKTFDETQKNLQTVLDKLNHEAKRDLGISKLDIGKENQASAYAEYLADLEAIKKVEALLATLSTPIRPPASAGQITEAAMGSTTNTRNWNFNYTTQQSMGSVQQDIAIAQALAGV